MSFNSRLSLNSLLGTSFTLMSHINLTILTGSQMVSTKCCHFQWPWVTCNTCNYSKSPHFCPRCYARM